MKGARTKVCKSRSRKNLLKEKKNETGVWRARILDTERAASWRRRTEGKRKAQGIHCSLGPAVPRNQLQCPIVPIVPLAAKAKRTQKGGAGTERGQIPCK